MKGGNPFAGFAKDLLLPAAIVAAAGSLRRITFASDHDSTQSNSGTDSMLWPSIRRGMSGEHGRVDPPRTISSVDGIDNVALESPDSTLDGSIPLFAYFQGESPLLYSPSASPAGRAAAARRTRRFALRGAQLNLMMPGEPASASERTTVNVPL